MGPLGELGDLLNLALGLGKQDGYVCEHGERCEPGGKTDCQKCPEDPAKVKYRPRYVKEDGGAV